MLATSNKYNVHLRTYPGVRVGGGECLATSNKYNVHLRTYPEELREEISP